MKCEVGFWGCFLTLQIGKTFELHPNGNAQNALTLAEQCQLALGFITAITWGGGSHLTHPHSASFVRCCLLSRAAWDFPPVQSDRSQARRHRGRQHSQVTAGTWAAWWLHFPRAVTPSKVVPWLYIQTRKQVLQECEGSGRRALPLCWGSHL